MLRYLLTSLLVKGYDSEDRPISIKLMPFAVKKLEEILPNTPPYLNSYLILGKGYEVLGHESGDPKIEAVSALKGADYYKKALALVPNQQTAVVAVRFVEKAVAAKLALGCFFADVAWADGGIVA